MSSSIGMMTIPIYRKIKFMFQSPPTSQSCLNMINNDHQRYKYSMHCLCIYHCMTTINMINIVVWPLMFKATKTAGFLVVIPWCAYAAYIDRYLCGYVSRKSWHVLFSPTAPPSTAKHGNAPIWHFSQDSSRADRCLILPHRILKVMQSAWQKHGFNQASSESITKDMNFTYDLTMVLGL